MAGGGRPVGPGLRLVDGLDVGTVVWVNLDPTHGREQAGHRPCVVVSSRTHLELVTELVTVVPVTTRDRQWVNHVELTPAGVLDRPSWAMTEQVRTLDRSRIRRIVGRVDEECLGEIAWWAREFLL